MTRFTIVRRDEQTKTTTVLGYVNAENITMAAIKAARRFANGGMYDVFVQGGSN